MQEAPVRLFRGGERMGRLKGRPVDEAALAEVPHEAVGPDLGARLLERAGDAAGRAGEPRSVGTRGPAVTRHERLVGVHAGNVLVGQ